MIDELKIYEILTKRKYSRENPYLEDQLKERIHFFIGQNKPIKLLGFWGVGSKERVNWADIKTCENLNKMNDEIKHIYNQGIEFTFIFATNHGVHNGISIEDSKNYIGEMKDIFKKFNFKFEYLNDFWEKYNINFEKIDKILNEKEISWWDKIENRELIENSAKARNNRLDAETAAQKYYIMRNLEKDMIEKEFTGYIFHAFSDSRYRNVLPELPTLYLFSIEKRRSDPPWFVIEDNK